MYVYLYISIYTCMVALCRAPLHLYITGKHVPVFRSTPVGSWRTNVTSVTYLVSLPLIPNNKTHTFFPFHTSLFMMLQSCQCVSSCFLYRAYGQGFGWGQLGFVCRREFLRAGRESGSEGTRGVLEQSAQIRRQDTCAASKPLWLTGSTAHCQQTLLVCWQHILHLFI